MHSKRTWVVSSVATPEELAEKLTTTTWTLCTAFFVEGHPDYLFLNDATCEDGAAEFGIVKGGIDAEEHSQLESITFSWCGEEKALTYIQKIIAGKYDAKEWVRPIPKPKLQTPEQHGHCSACA